jgi:hypothetical protein
MKKHILAKQRLSNNYILNERGTMKKAYAVITGVLLTGAQGIRADGLDLRLPAGFFVGGAVTILGLQYGADWWSGKTEKRKAEKYIARAEQEYSEELNVYTIQKKDGTVYAENVDEKQLAKWAIRRFGHQDCPYKKYSDAILTSKEKLNALKQEYLTPEQSTKVKALIMKLTELHSDHNEHLQKQLKDDRGTERMLEKHKADVDNRRKLTHLTEKVEEVVKCNRDNRAFNQTQLDTLGAKIGTKIEHAASDIKTNTQTSVQNGVRDVQNTLQGQEMRTLLTQAVTARQAAAPVPSAP